MVEFLLGAGGLLVVLDNRWARPATGATVLAEEVVHLVSSAPTSHGLAPSRGACLRSTWAGLSILRADAFWAPRCRICLTGRSSIQRAVEPIH